MKKLVILMSCFIPLMVYSQKYPTGKGTFRTGGGASFTQTREVGYNEYKFSITPRLGYFITDEWLTGFNMNYTMVYNEDFISAIKFTPMVKYFYKLSPSTFLLGNLEIGLDRATTFGYTRSIVDHTSVSFGPGVSYYFSRRIGFEIDILYQQYVNPDKNHMSKIDASGGFIFNILTNKDKQKSNRKHNYKLQEEDDE